MPEVVIIGPPLSDLDTVVVVTVLGVPPDLGTPEE